ncbi:MAG: hypothetical protein KME07_25245 [Pegethrix bostrychoides GSE-TBD4-15B]|jgi:hypothetical protein|uniref:Uncharacterized protein n=1 Tax=Pegethrix bostrychoides GSE-TBD4-15B TaxID=2839662 RepID=A0A951PFG7_9CYAN|nr:hypothetical protein [Pegethrix bostrychoides GSE-TBD4-15B]
MKGLIQYFYEIKFNKVVLWCYLIWYVVTVYFYFDPSPKIWINSLGISAVIGTGLMFSVSSGQPSRLASSSAKRDGWQIFRLYLMPFCVSSFSALIKDQGFIIVVSPNVQETAVAAFCCCLFLSMVWVVKLLKQ